MDETDDDMLRYGSEEDGNVKKMKTQTEDADSDTDW